MNVSVKTLTPDDWEDWKKIRLEAIQLHPESFGGSYEDEIQKTDEHFKQALEKSTIFGAYNDKDLVGVVGFFIFSGLKLQHRGNIFSMYLNQSFRSQGISDALMQAVIHYAKMTVQQLHCTVVTENVPAIKLYKKYGFEIYGTEPRSLKIENRYYDEHLMILMFENEK